MTPDPAPTPAERAAELDVAAAKADHKGDLVFAAECRSAAEHLRRQEAIKCGQAQKS